MLHKSKLLVFIGSMILVLYGVSAAFYGRVVANEDAYSEISVFMDVLDRVKNDYVEDPDMRKVHEGTMQGLIDALDPYSSFLSKEKYASIRKRNETSQAGAGMVISKRSEVVYIVSCDPSGPASRAGIRPGDYVVAIDGKPVEEKSIFEVSSLLRGSPGTQILVEIYRNSRSQPLQVTLTLQEPLDESITASMPDRNIGLLKVASLEKPAAGQIENELRTLIDKGSNKIVLDLRNCADGAPKAGAELANLFLPDGIIYYSRNRAGEKVEIVEADPEKFITDRPVVVLINGSTASAAEIAAGALKDRGRATIVGERSFGIGSAQKMIELKSGSILLLTTLKFCTPKGKIIQDETVKDAGIAPDILVPDKEKRQDLAVESYYDDLDEIEKYNQFRRKIEQLQMEKALEVLHEDKVTVEAAA